MIAWKFKLWRSAGAAAAIGLAACGQADNAATPPDTSAPAPTAPTASSGEAGIGEGGGEHGGADAAAYAGASGVMLTALRLQHLKGIVIAAQYITEGDRPGDAGALVAQGLNEIYTGHEGEFATLDITLVRAASNGAGLNRAQMMQRLRNAQAAIEHASAPLQFDAAALTVRMIDLATGEYGVAMQGATPDPTAYSQSRGAAFAARDALMQQQDPLRRRNFLATSQALAELNTFVDMWPSADPPPEPATYQQVLTQGSRIRLTLSPLLNE